MRRVHIVRENKATEYPQQCIWFDTETDFETIDSETISHKLRFGYACYKRRHRNGVWTDETWLRFTTRDQFWRFVSAHVRKQTKLYLFCHNTSFDLPVLDVFTELPKHGFILRSAIIDAPPTILRFRRGSECIMILDTLNIWRMPLKYMGEEIGVPKLDMPDNNDLGLEWETYAKRDVEIIMSACVKWWNFLESEDMGSFAPTLAGQAMKVFRHRYMTHQILIDDNEKALKLTREGYYGGRVDCFYIGHYTDKFTLLDVNSMYPFVMANHDFPHRLVSHTRYANLDDIRNWLPRYSLMARVILRTNIPFAPVKDHHKLVFPIGEFECILSTPELQYALERAEIVHVIECAVYHKAFLFTTMMHDLYARRVKAKEEKNYVRDFMYKKLLNSFYGKWGQAGCKWVEQDNIPDLSCKRWIVYDMETGKITQHRQLGGLRQSRDTDAESRDSFPAIAAHVTAYARMELWNIIQLAGVENVYYCDTDCVLVNNIGRRRLEYKCDETNLGGLKVSGEYDDIQIWAPKDYRFGSKEKHKGVRKDAVWADSNTVYQARWSGLRGIVSSGIVDKPITKRVRKHLSRVYDKGVIMPDGRVQPLLMIPGEHPPGV